MRFATQFQGVHRRALLALVVVALMIVLLPTAASASSGRYGRSNQRHYPQQQLTYRHSPQQQYQHYCATTYKVRKGDTLSHIARHYRVSVHALSKVNGIKNPNRIYAGQHLCITH